MKKLLKTFEQKAPEIVFEWKDPETEAEGWVVINSLRGGAAGGGTRMRAGLDKHEVISLAKTMEVKFTVSGPPIGGAKSGINFDPRDPRKKGVLFRWFSAVKPLLKYYYGTGGDLNVDEIHEVIPITEDVGVWHPQEGVFNGHYQPREAQIINRIGQLRQGVIKVIEDERYTPDINKKFTVADMITGYGVAEAVRHYYSLWGGNLHVKRAVIQGWGNVAGAAGFYLAKMGVNVVGIIDREGGVIKQEGFTYEEIRHLFLNRDGNQLTSPDMIPYDELEKRIWDLEFEIFVPAAASRLISREQVDRMINSRLEVFSCGANVPFDDPEIFFGPTGLYADQNFSVIPDFVANCGMARVFAHLMEEEVEMTDEEIFNDVSTTIRRALETTYKMNSTNTRIAQTSFEIALRQLI
jgi:glutamate dehydrogenase/leucine dehydrogenase